MVRTRQAALEPAGRILKFYLHFFVIKRVETDEWYQLKFYVLFSTSFYFPIFIFIVFQINTAKTTNVSCNVFFAEARAECTKLKVFVVASSSML